VPVAPLPVIRLSAVGYQPMTLWTPGGEYPVDRDRDAVGGGGPTADDAEDPFAGLSADERTRLEEIAAEMDEVRRQLASVPAAVVVANHVMGLYELAAVHLSQEPPAFEEGRLAIDAMGAVIEGLEGRLGENEPTLRDALGQLRLAFVQLKARSEPGAPPPTDPGGQAPPRS
jgi:hypothetical protein